MRLDWYVGKAERMDISSWLIGLGAWFFVLAVLATFGAVLSIVGMWRVLERVGKPGWAALVPFYGTWEFAVGSGMQRNLCIGMVACQAVAFALSLSGMGGAAVAVAAMALLSFVVLFAVACDSVRRRFGYGAWMTAAMVLVPFVGLPMVGFSGCSGAGERASARQMARSRGKDAAARLKAAAALSRRPSVKGRAVPAGGKPAAKATRGGAAARRAFYDSLSPQQQMEFDMLASDAERSAYYKRTMAARADG